MKKTIALFGFLILNFCATANPQNLFEQANKKYQEHAYAEAIVLYDSIVNQGYINAETYYNLGNAYYRMGSTGMAILNYEKALKLNPKNEDAQHNLKLAKQATIDQFNAVPTPALQRIFQDFSGIMSSGSWAILAVIWLAIAVLCATIFFFVNKRTFWLTAILIALLLAGITETIAYGKHNLEQKQYAIITVPNAYVKSAPASTAEDLFILHEGTKAHVLNQYNGWTKVKLPDGKIGWLQAKATSVI